MMKVGDRYRDKHGTQKASIHRIDRTRGIVPLYIPSRRERYQLLELPVWFLSHPSCGWKPIEPVQKGHASRLDFK